MEQPERVKGSVLGQAVGDALGVPVEFVSRDILKKDPVLGLRGYGTHHQKPGTWSDDTSLMLCLLESLNQDGFDLDELGRKFVAWRQNGYWTPHGEVFDIGLTTSRAITRLKQGISPLLAGDDGEGNNGNGSLMRILPVSFRIHSSDAELAGLAQQISCLSHRHPRSQMSCGLFVLLCRRLLSGISPVTAYREMIVAGKTIYQVPPYKGQLSHFQRLLSGDLAEIQEPEIESGGYVIHTLEASIWCLLTTSSFSEAVLKAVNLGQDSDTTGAVAGALAGAVYGLSGIPQEWVALLARRDDIMKLVDQKLKIRQNN